MEKLEHYLEGLAKLSVDSGYLPLVTICGEGRTGKVAVFFQATLTQAQQFEVMEAGLQMMRTRIADDKYKQGTALPLDTKKGKIERLD
jgi:hypothetical protein